MKQQIKLINAHFERTFMLYSGIDRSLPTDAQLILLKEDKKALKLYYKLWNMKRFTKSYFWFEVAAKQFAVKRNIPVTSAAMEICQAANGELK